MSLLLMPLPGDEKHTQMGRQLRAKLARLACEGVPDELLTRGRMAEVLATSRALVKALESDDMWLVQQLVRGLDELTTVSMKEEV